VEESPQPATETPILVVDGFSKSYEDQRAVSDLSFQVWPGEILGLVGPNGAGKTTTLRSIAGILPIRDGRITVAGHDVAREETAAKFNLCWVPDDPQPFEALTVEEHLEFTASLYRLRDWRARADELIRRFELDEKRGALGGELSRGMRQKLAFCSAWLPQPRLVLLDEPLSGLDPRGIRSAKQAILDLAAEGTGVILSSHLLELIEELAHRLLILDRGRMVFVGTLAEARATLAPREGSTLEEIFMAATESGGEADAAPTP
jgi:ABC-2 type transport system ATP-binding protein